MTGDDLIIAAPWLVFAAGLAVIGWRLAVSRGDALRPARIGRLRRTARAAMVTAWRHVVAPAVPVRRRRGRFRY